MFKINPITQKIVLTKGDDASLYVKVRYVDDADYELKAEDKIVMTVRKKADSEEVSMQKTANNGFITIVPKDTANLATGTYVYDVQLTNKDGKIYTIIPASLFEIVKEVTR